MMSDYEEDLDDFPMLSTEHTSENGAFRAESTDQWRTTSGITTKIPRLFNGLTSRFKYEELIDDWLDLTVLEAGKRRPAVKNRLVGVTEMHKGLLGRESLRSEDGVKYFKHTLRPHFIKEAQSVFLWRFYQFIRANGGNIEMVKWIGKFSLLLKRLRDAWMDLLLASSTSEQVTAHEIFPFGEN